MFSVSLTTPPLNGTARKTKMKNLRRNLSSAVFMVQQAAGRRVLVSTDVIFGA